MNAQAQPETQADIEIARLVEHARAFGDEDLYHGKRAWPRFNAALQLEATKDAQDPSAGWTVSMHNVSMGGFAAWSKTELERHDIFYVREFASQKQRPWLKAIVRHCTRGLRGYLIGAEFMDMIVPVDHETTTQDTLEPDDTPEQQDRGDSELRDQKVAHLMDGIRRYREHGFRQR